VRAVEPVDEVGPQPNPAVRHVLLADDATVWVWIIFGLVQAVVTMLTAFDVIETFTVSEVITAVTLVVYVAVNELIVRPRRRRAAGKVGGDAG
jgi:membrane protein YdbS with pleckstrin-like domain